MRSMVQMLEVIFHEPRIVDLTEGHRVYVVDQLHKHRLGADKPEALEQFLQRPREYAPSRTAVTWFIVGALRAVRQTVEMQGFSATRTKQAFHPQVGPYPAGVSIMPEASWHRGSSAHAIKQ